MRFLFVDRIVHSAPGQLIQGVKHITSDDYFLTVDEQGCSCFIPSLIGETLGQLAAWNVMQANSFSHRPVAGIVASARLHRPAYVGESLLLESFIDNLDEQAVQYHSVARVGEDIVFSVEGALGPLLPMDEFISLETIQQQFKDIYRPGDWKQILETEINQVKALPLKPKSQHAVSITFDRICTSVPGSSLVAEKRVSLSAPYLPDHFPKKPVLPMTVLLECQLNLAAEFIKRAQYDIDYKVYELRKIKMSEFVYPGDILTCTVTVKRHQENELILNYRTEVANKRVCVVDIVLIPRGQ